MVDATADTLKQLLLGGSPWPLLVVVSALAAFGIVTRRAGTAVSGIAAVCVLCWFASLPFIANGLATGFGALPHAPARAADIAGIQAIVVLGGGASWFEADGRQLTVASRRTALNALEGARLYELTSGTAEVIASGGIVDTRGQQVSEAIVLRRLLTDVGVPASRIRLEADSRTTREQVQRVAALLRAQHLYRFAVVTAPVHLARAVAGFRRDGLNPIAAPARYESERPRSRPSPWLPSREALEQSSDALYDYLAFAYYWVRGWIRVR